MSEDQIGPFDNPVRLFPLAGAVLLPHGTLPLHIFEPRYVAMTEHALAGDRRITMVWPSAAETPAGGPPALQPVGCIGRIVNEQRLPDGRYTFLLMGETRVALREVPSPYPFRLADAVPLEDVQARNFELLRELHRSDILCGLQQLLQAPKELAQHFLSYLQEQRHDGAFADIVAHAIPVPLSTKQQLLATRSVDERLALLDQAIRAMTPQPIGVGRRFPPGESAN